MLDASWMGFASVGDFVESLDREHLLVSRVEEHIENHRCCHYSHQYKSTAAHNWHDKYGP